MKMHISTITPVHVGSGAEYGRPEFYLAVSKGKNVLVKADISRLFMMLSDEMKDEFIIQLEDPQFNLQSFLKQIMSQLPSGGLGNIRLYFSYLESKLPDNISEHIKTSHQAYIPGTSIKGSIKSALLYDMIDGNDLNQLENLIRRGRNGKYEIRKWDSQNFIDNFFSSDPKKRPNTSIMRFLQVTDTSPVNKMTIYSMNSVKANQKGWTWYRHSIDMGKTYIEAIGKNQKMEFDLNLNQTDEIIRELNLEYKKDYLSMDRILESVYNFSRDLIYHEIDFAEKYEIDFLEDFYKELVTQNTKESPVLNIGQGTGFLASTISMKIKEYDAELYDKVREATRGKTYPNEFPKTRKVILEDKIPLGWVKVG